MTVPNIVNTTGVTGALSGTTGSQTLPGSRVSGNYLIAELQLGTSGPQTITVDGGWTIPGFGEQTDANMSTAWAYRYVDGSEAAPNFSWDTTAPWHCRITQVHGVTAGGAIGAHATASGSGTTLTAASVNTTEADSMIFAMLFGYDGSTIPLPSSYTNVDDYSDGFGSDRTVYETIATAGNPSDAISVTIPSALSWHSYVIELTSGAPTGAADLVASGQLLASSLVARATTAVLAGSGFAMAVAQTDAANAVFPASGRMSADAGTNQPRAILAGSGNIDVSTHTKSRTGAAAVLTGL